MRRQAMLQGMLTLGLFLVILPPNVQADFTVVPKVSDPIPLTLTDWNKNTESLAGKNPFQVQQFNPNDYASSAPPGQVAQLTGVGIRLTYSFHNQITMRFDNVSTITVNAHGDMHLALPGVLADIVAAPHFDNVGTQTSSKGDTFPKSVDITPPLNLTNKHVDAGYTTANVLAAFTGSGQVLMPVTATATSDFTTTSGNGRGTSDTAAGASISVLYYYRFVPEPSGVVLMGLGGVGVLTVYRRRVRRKD